MKTKRVNLIGTAITLSIVLLLQGCNEQNEKQASQQDEVQVVSAVKAEKIIYTPELKFSGVAKASRHATLSTALPGRVERLHVRKGDHVEQGQLIAELSDEMLIQAIVAYETLKTDYERLSRLVAKGSVSQVDYDHLKAKFEAAEARKALMDKNTRLVAPFKGIIAEVYIEEGENYSLMPSGLSGAFKLENCIVKLINYNPVKVEIAINEKIFPQLFIGQMAALRFDAFPDTVFSAQVDYISEELSATTHSAKVDLLLENPDLLVKPGMFAQVFLQLNPRETVFVPLQSIYRQAGTANDFVFVIQDDVVHRKRITQAEMVGDRVAVNGLLGDELLVTAGKNLLTDGAKVRIN